MTSKEINDLIVKIDNLESHYESSIGGKLIPYIGWFWRNVNFDEYPYPFCIIPEGNESGTYYKSAVGFTVNNKWDYNYVNVTTEQCLEIRRAIEKAVISLDYEDFALVDKMIQDLAKY